MPRAIGESPGKKCRVAGALRFILHLRFQNGCLCPELGYVQACGPFQAAKITHLRPKKEDLIVSRKLIRITLLSLAALGLFVLIGCVDKKINLIYSPVTKLDMPCTKSVAVVAFADKRSDKTLGQTTGSKTYYTDGDIGQWVSKALADELGRNGCKVSFVSSAAEAKGADYVLTGEVYKVFFRRPAYASFYTDMDLKVAMAHDDFTFFTQTFHVETYEDGTAPDESYILERDLQEAMKKVVPEIVSRVQ
jgi:hypothetical protein